MNDFQTKQAIQQALQTIDRQGLKATGLALLEAMGYRSDKRLELSPNTSTEFINTFSLSGKLNPQRALLDQWQTVDLLFQLTRDEIRASSQLQLNFGASNRVDNTIIESYLFLAIGLVGERYTRSQLAQITREINKQFNMPVMVLFRHGRALTLAVINRRLHKRDESKDVLEKVTLIKDIRTQQPHRAHLEILSDLALPHLADKYGVTNFVELHRAWEQTLDSSELNKRFFREVANWYFWAVQRVTFPHEAHPDPEVRNATSVIRLITRLIFVWFLKEKGLVPDDLFNDRKLKGILKAGVDPKGSTYYKAILQNLFFATLNQEMNTPSQPDNRKFRGKASQPGGRDQHHMIHNVYRYEAYFQHPQQALQLFANVPFLNGGLFECLDKPDPADPKTKLRIDGFSDRADNPLRVPDDLFFGDEREVDLNDVYGTSNKSYKVRGLIHILDSYKFTVDENTPIEEEIALDPELLGKVFENLLAAYNPETGVTARKQTGSFYTPREIVNYMVDESLIAYLEAKTEGEIEAKVEAKEEINLALASAFEARLRHLLAYNDEPHQFNSVETAQLIEAIDTVKILDPACGSGAFLMGILHKLVFILGKLDPHNERWKETQKEREIQPVLHDIQIAQRISEESARELAIQRLQERLKEIEDSFENNELDYGRKLYLIENCLYGVDIQPIAVQIAKLRCFISLIVDQRIDDTQPNRGIIPLPNLETKFVAANTLIGISRTGPTGQFALRDPEIAEKEKALEQVRNEHFKARTPKKKRECRDRDEQLRNELSEILRKRNLFSGPTAYKLAHWNPYDQNTAADFFDPDWMFEIKEGFDIIIGNPPYINTNEMKDVSEIYRRLYTTAYGSYDIYVIFFEKSKIIAKPNGIICFITSNKYFIADYGVKLRELILRDLTIVKLLDLADCKRVFPAALVSPCITILSNRAAPYNTSVDVAVLKDEDVKLLPNVGFETRQIKELASGTNKIFDIHISGSTQTIIDKLVKNSLELGRLSDVRTGVMGFDYWSLAEFIYDGPFKNGIRIATNGFIDRYEFTWGKKAKLYKQDFYAPYLDINECPLNENTKDLFRKSKIIIRGVARRLSANIDEEGIGLLVAVHCAVIKDPVKTNPRYVLALLNSSLLNWYHVVKFYTARIPEGSLKYPISFLKSIPIRQASASEQRPIITLVDQILAAKKVSPNADTSVLEGEIDRMVYQLYGLSEEEIAIVEGSDR